MAEMNVKKYQVHTLNDTKSHAAENLDDDLLAAHKEMLEGGFLRDANQLNQEKRLSIRIDDTAQCVLALTRTLKLLDSLIGVEVPAHSKIKEQEGEDSSTERRDRGSEL